MIARHPLGMSQDELIEAARILLRREFGEAGLRFVKMRFGRTVGLEPTISSAVLRGYNTPAGT